MISARHYCIRAKDALAERGKDRDSGEERSMSRIVATFNAMTGYDLTEREGWAFMCCLKMVRAMTTPSGKVDDYVDLCAYAALMGESARLELEAE